jgi:hypothetical protein
VKIAASSFSREQSQPPRRPLPPERNHVKAPAYDRMGIDYRDVRRADPRIEIAIWARSDTRAPDSP